MKRFNRISFLFCGIALLLAAFPVFAQKSGEFNRKPLDDLAALLRQKIEKKETDFNKPFRLEMKGVLTADGRLDPKKSKFTRAEGDSQMNRIAKAAIHAFGNSGVFRILKDQGIEKISLSATQDAATFSSVLTSELPTPEKAATTVSMFNVMLNMVLMADRNGFKKIDENSRALIENSTVNSKEKSVIISFSMPKADFQEMVTRVLKVEEKNENVQK